MMRTGIKLEENKVLGVKGRVIGKGNIFVGGSWGSCVSCDPGQRGLITGACVCPPNFILTTCPSSAMNPDL